MRPAIKTPFPYVGNKTVAAPLIWKVLDHDGKLEAYTEPFVGSCSLLLWREKIIRPETINDADGMMINLWRAIRLDPDGVAKAALEQPVSEVDLHAHHLVLNAERKNLTARLSADPDFCKVRLAGWCLDGLCTWIGSNFGTDTGPWVRALDEYCVPVMCSPTGKGEEATGGTVGDGSGMRAQIPHISDDGSGMRAQIPHISNDGKGVRAQIPHISNDGSGVSAQTRIEWLTSWMRKIQARLADVRVTCGDWKRTLSSESCMNRKTPHGIVLDPPYDPSYQESGSGVGYHTGTESSSNSKRGNEHASISKECQDWCIEHGANMGLRIVICGRGTEHDVLLQHGWVRHASKGRVGYNKSAEQAHKTEAVWASPGCPPLPEDEKSLHI
jgi:DNA adenine methylase